MAHTGGGESNDTIVIPLTKDGLDLGGFTRTVGADQSHHLTAVDMQIYILYNIICTELDGKILDAQAAGAVAGLTMSEFSHPKAPFNVSMFSYMASK